MFGTLRLLLAAMVALAHAGVDVHGHHLGVPAVVVFYMLSGYVVAGLLREGSPLAADARLFFAERALRLLPLYTLFAALGALAWQAGASSGFLQGQGTPAQWAANLLVIPLDLFMFFPALDKFVLVPPAWSLGLELQFYLLAPWLLRRPPAMAALGAASLAVQAAAVAGWLHTDWYGYRLLCGNLFMFLSGAWLYRVVAQGADPRPLALVWGVMAVLAAAAGASGRWSVFFNLEVQWGLLAGLPLLAVLARQPRRRLDDALGQLAYGVFLAHFPVMWLAILAGWLSPGVRPLGVYLALVVAAAAAGHLLVERPLIRWRHRLRQAH